MKAVTDADPTEPNSVKPEPIANLFCHDGYRFNERYIRFLQRKVQQLRNSLRRFEEAAGRRYQQLLCTDPRKDYRHPFQRGIHGESSPHGSRKARESAAKTLAEVREIIGFRPY